MKAIETENLSKLYRLGGRMNNSIREAISSFGKRQERQELWALKDVSFEVEQGETLGIIGKNGAGKSTLLKILSRITKPTQGSAILYGRVGSLLEVGTGFHNELSGRENVYLSGAILGMKRAEIAAKFDEIIAFAEIEKFIDTPVKHYSSGMFMRLAFSVAAHLDTEILIVDEVLAVGDSDFQFKSLDKMQEIMRQGRTILFVSHNLSAVSRLCTQAIALNSGKIVSRGETGDVLKDYLGADWGIVSEKVWTENFPQNEFVRLHKVRVIDETGNPTEAADISKRFGLEATYEVLKPFESIISAFHIYTQDRQYLFGLQDTMSEWKRRKREVGTYKSTVWIPENFFNAGNFIADFALSSHFPQTMVHVNEREVISFEVLESAKDATTRGDYTGKIDGSLRPHFDWQTEVY
jgi:lipopolysaccharide transport system ATP-binding protein